MTVFLWKKAHITEKYEANFESSHPIERSHLAHHTTSPCLQTSGSGRHIGDCAPQESHFERQKQQARRIEVSS